MKAFLVYALKWQLGAIVTIPSIYFFHEYLGWSHFWTTIAFQALGACVFWNVDKFIFTKLNS